MNTNPPVRRYEDNAGPATIITPKGTVQGWACLTCNRVFASSAETDQHIARYCCATDLPCGEEGCTGRAEKPYTCCGACLEKKHATRYAALAEAEWDGETPLVTFDGDQYFYDEDGLLDYCADEDVKIADLRLVICQPVGLPEFDVFEFLSGYLYEDCDVEDFAAPPQEIDKSVDDWIQKHAPKSWEAGKTRPTIASLPKEETPESEKEEE